MVQSNNATEPYVDPGRAQEVDLHARDTAWRHLAAGRGGALELFKRRSVYFVRDSPYKI